MTKILLVPVNFNSYTELASYIESVETAYSMCPNYALNLTVYIADNSTTIENILIPQNTNISYLVNRNGNLGYFGGIKKVLEKITDITEYDYVVFSNVDLTISKTFFAALLNNDSKNVGWIAPRIWSSVEERDKNPKILNRYTKRKLQLLKLLWRHPILHKIYTQTLYKRKKKTKYTHSRAHPKEIYAGHGSFIILTRDFFIHYPELNYPIFLFGEEIFLAELCRKRNLKVIYRPELIIYDSEHISTSKMGGKFYYKCNFDAIEYLLKNFYE